MMDTNFLATLRAVQVNNIARRDTFYAGATQLVASMQVSPTATVRPSSAAAWGSESDMQSLTAGYAQQGNPPPQASRLAPDTLFGGNSAGNGNGATNTGFEGNSYSPYTY